MIGKALTMAALVAASISVPGMAQQQRPQSEDYGAKKICKREGRVGSRLGGKRTCRTQEEWDRLSRETRLATEHLQRGVSQCASGPNGPRGGFAAC
jgi:hypothetical protein